MNETLTQHVVLSDGEYDRLTARLALAEAVVEAARPLLEPVCERRIATISVKQRKEIASALDAYDRSAAQEREGT